ncbi:hypothetical protein CDD82_2306 [Ophiocordyceps australis]|uniref:Uncharacterized protein n=1 Tax=Ophiocordyceps australis TaxID=1399860 RepID=A0A2C5ZCH2_9HYPO|nr:hypothetical protein CDD82_2306 [Ophiocordyceps australis]
MDEPSALRWSGTYALVAPPRSLTGDKIILPQSALQQLLSITSTTDPFALHENTHQLPHPLTFRLVNTQNGNTVYAGIREFSSPEETLALSPFLLEALAVNPQHLATELVDDAAILQIVVHAEKLSKGTYVRLRPLEAGYNPDDWKSLLERHLRDNYTCLTRNTTLSVQGVRGETFQFLVDQIAPQGDGICVVDTDLEVDIEALNEEQARETLRQIVSTSTKHNPKDSQLDIWKDVAGQVSPKSYADYHLASWNRTQPLTITISEIQQADSLDLFVTPRSARQRALPRDSIHVFGDFGPAKDGTKSVTIAPTNAEMEDAESISISVASQGNPFK